MHAIHLICEAVYSGELEAYAALLAVRRLVRRPRLHSHRMLFLMDAISVLSALQKGRSSAPSLRICVRRISALVLAANLRIRYGYIPSEWNPADAPSRGLHPLRRRRRLGHPASRFDCWLRKTALGLAKLENPGFSEDLMGQASSSSSW